VWPQNLAAALSTVTTAVFRHLHSGHWLHTHTCDAVLAGVALGEAVTTMLVVIVEVDAAVEATALRLAWGARDAPAPLAHLGDAVQGGSALHIRPRLA
jgi:hypothetical protein